MRYLYLFFAVAIFSITAYNSFGPGIVGTPTGQPFTVLCTVDGVYGATGNQMTGPEFVVLTCPDNRSDEEYMVFRKNNPIWADVVQKRAVSCTFVMHTYKRKLALSQEVRAIPQPPCHRTFISWSMYKYHPTLWVKYQ